MMHRVLVVPWSIDAMYCVIIGEQLLVSDEVDGVGEHTGDDAADERADDRDPGVAPVAVALALDRQHGVGDARHEVTSRVDGVARRATERGTDTDNDQTRRPRGPRPVGVCARSARSQNTSTKVPMVSVMTFQTGVAMPGPVEKTPSLLGTSVSGSSKWSRYGGPSQARSDEGTDELRRGSRR